MARYRQVRQRWTPLLLLLALLSCSGETDPTPATGGGSATASTGGGAGAGAGGSGGYGGAGASGGAGGSGTVIISEGADEGLECFVISTDRAVFYFDKVGAGFTSLVDAEGLDWIDFHPEGTPGVPDGQSGWYRGIPNMGLDQFGHPGYAGATSTTPDPLGEPLSKATIVAEKDAWRVSWEFYPRYAKMTVHSVGDNYWLLYEGTPGGTFGPSDSAWRSDGSSFALGDSWSADLAAGSGVAAAAEWVSFTDDTVDRSLTLVHTDDGITDHYRPMDPMTVFGFGRQAADTSRLLTATDTVLLLGFAESRLFDDVAAELDSWLQAGALDPAPDPG